ncbi:MAG: hypothetical protein NTU49_07310 [Gammaproteobacteria bacterium]|nr:hypothetical protein [Gammaproteobacteria bacterium]
MIRFFKKEVVKPLAAAVVATGVVSGAMFAHDAKCKANKKPEANNTQPVSGIQVGLVR